MFQKLRSLLKTDEKEEVLEIGIVREDWKAANVNVNIKDLLALTTNINRISERIRQCQDTNLLFVVSHSKNTRKYEGNDLKYSPETGMYFESIFNKFLEESRVSKDETKNFMAELRTTVKDFKRFLIVAWVASEMTVAFQFVRVLANTRKKFVFEELSCEVVVYKDYLQDTRKSEWVRKYVMREWPPKRASTAEGHPAHLLHQLFRCKDEMVPTYLALLDEMFAGK